MKLYTSGGTPKNKYIKTAHAAGLTNVIIEYRNALSQNWGWILMCDQIKWQRFYDVGNMLETIQKYKSLQY